jgi:hypothetical protein
MRKLVAALVGAVVLGTAGFAAASAVQAAKPPKGGGSTTGTGTGTGTTASHKVVICHRTKSNKKPWHTITVNEHAVPAHMAHGDKLGACPTTTAAQAAAAAAAKAKAKEKSGGNSGNHGKPSNPGNSGGDHGKSGGHGKGK